MARAPQWNVKGVDGAARNAARDAAAAAGLPIGTWIDRAVKRAAASQPTVIPSPTRPATDATSRSLIERAINHGPATGEPSESPPQLGPVPEIPADRVPRSTGSHGVGRGIRIAVAIVIMAALTGGAVWLLNEQMQPPQIALRPSPSPSAEAPPAPPQPASPPSETALQNPAAPRAGSSATPDASGLEALRQAAQAGDARAQYDLGVRYTSGRDTPKDDALAATRIGEQYADDFQPVTAQYVRLNILEATDGPTIWEFQLQPPGKAR